MVNCEPDIATLNMNFHFEVQLRIYEATGEPSNSNLLNDRGVSIAEPLRRGGDLCLFHARAFCCQAVQIQEAVVIFIDLETTGLDAARDRIEDC